MAWSQSVTHSAAVVGTVTANRKAPQGLPHYPKADSAGNGIMPILRRA